MSWPSAILKEAHRAQALPERIASDKLCSFFRAYSRVLALRDRGVRMVYWPRSVR